MACWQRLWTLAVLCVLLCCCPMMGLDTVTSMSPSPTPAPCKQGAVLSPCSSAGCGGALREGAWPAAQARLPFSPHVQLFGGGERLLFPSLFPRRPYFQGPFRRPAHFSFPLLQEKRLADVGRKSSPVLMAGYFGSGKADGPGGDKGQELCLGVQSLFVP